ncbi:hypothetical protein H920_01669 [Fukomys damarensis]|uniref:Uncharacterized protein n=1 Tax=Fukomys damarensis TaxID=885580 RepID=A0A091E0Z2_FUKDA|nr:hypothetical protein H920_01669 [Fukomys damarensis]
MWYLPDTFKDTDVSLPASVMRTKLVANPSILCFPTPLTGVGHELGTRKAPDRHLYVVSENKTGEASRLTSEDSGHTQGGMALDSLRGVTGNNDTVNFKITTEHMEQMMHPGMTPTETRAKGPLVI